jgi:hypothetical protein
MGYINSYHSASAIAYITSDYNTGYMLGKIKLATLSDTDTTNAVGAELITNGTFASNTTGWGGTGTLSIDSGRLKVLGGYASQSFTTVVGKKYVLTWTVTDGNDGGGIYLGTASSPYVYLTSGEQSTGTYNHTFVATTTSTYLRLYAWHGGSTFAFFDNVSARLAEEDRSVNGKGLQVFGTVTKTAVATGADLVGYSGFSSSNYLRQPYNSDLQVGTTGSIAFTFWFNLPGLPSASYFFDRAHSNGGKRIAVYINENGINVYTPDSAIPGFVFPYGVWNQLTVVRSGGNLRVYLNGVLKNSVANDEDLNTDGSVASGLILGSRFSVEYFLASGSMSLFRVSTTAPTAEQIAKIYNDEKHLFQTNAQATLYGSSDAVTALAYDDDTELLHVGTSAGRSEFQGLRRVNNTTDAVSAAISASNGFIVEE